MSLCNSYITERAQLETRLEALKEAKWSLFALFQRFRIRMKIRALEDLITEESLRVKKGVLIRWIDGLRDREVSFVDDAGIVILDNTRCRVFDSGLMRDSDLVASSHERRIEINSIDPDRELKIAYYKDLFACQFASHHVVRVEIQDSSIEMKPFTYSWNGSAYGDPPEYLEEVATFLAGVSIKAGVAR